MYVTDNEQPFLTELLLKISAAKITHDYGIVMVCHVMNDLEVFVGAVNSLIPIKFIVAIPYSTDLKSLEHLSKKYKILTPTLNELMDPVFLEDLFKQHISPLDKIIINDIGGYFAPTLDNLKTYLGQQLIGAVEDTELGHRQYERIANKLPCPVISVARSVLKEKEDFIVGRRCVTSFLNILQTKESVNLDANCLVMGYGKIGRAVAHELKLQGFKHIYVYDHDSIRLLQAHVEGFLIKHKHESLQRANFIFGATGNFSLVKHDCNYINDSVYLVSCSSKTVEFDLDYITQNYTYSGLNDYLEVYTANSKKIVLVTKGQPVNLNAGKYQSLVGPILGLVHAEIILAISAIILNNKTLPNGFSQLPIEDKQMVANLWLKHFTPDYK